jgi:hypothetical protein
MTHEFRRKAKAGEVILNNVALRIEGDIGYGIENSYGRKIQQGDPGPDDHPLDSTISQASWAGGIGTKKHRGDDTRGNSWWSTMHMQVEDVLSLRPKTWVHTLAGEENTLHYPHAKLGGKQYASFGTKLKEWSEGTSSFVAITGNPTLAAVPVAKGVTWGTDAIAKKLYIPQGTSYEVYSGGTTLAAGAVGEGAIGFVVWQQKLFKIDANGVVKVTVDGTTWTTKGAVPEDFTPRRMFQFFDKNNAPAVHVTTSGALYALDYENGYLVERNMQYPDHPDQGKGAATWRADAYVSVGLGVHRDANGLISAMGPDGREGLPEIYQDGAIVDMWPAYNGLLALLRGGTLAFTPTPETADAGVNLPQGMYSEEGNNAFALILEWNGLGWHPKWEGANTPTEIYVSSNSGIYRMFWGDRGHMYSQILPRGYYNPAYNQNQTPLERYGRHETPFYNYGVDDIEKIIKQFELKTVNCDENNYFVVWLRTSEHQEWGNGQVIGTPLATITTDGEHHLDIGFEEVGDEVFHLGKPVEHIQFAIDAYGDPNDEWRTPIIHWYTVVGRKWMRAFVSFDIQVNAEAAYDNLSPYKQWQHVLEASTKKGGSTLVIGDKTFEVDITSNTGNIQPEPDWKGYISLRAVLLQELDA